MNRLVMTMTAIAIGAMPLAAAETVSDEEGVPYTITFDGDRYPTGLENVEYPYSAGRLGLSGECRLDVLVDTANNIAAMTVANCSDGRFREASQRFINNQVFAGSTSLDLTSHPLTVSWSMEAEPAEIIIASN